MNKKMYLGVVATLFAFITLLAPCARGGGLPALTSLPIGSKEKLEKYNIGLVDTYVNLIYRKETNGTVTYFLNKIQTLYPKDKAEIDNLFQEDIKKGLTNILSSGSKDGTYAISAGLDTWTEPYIYATLFQYYSEFTLTNVNGHYQLPDFSGATMSLGSRIPILFPDINWAIVEVWDKVDDHLINIVDSRFEPDPWLSGVDASEQLLLLRTDYLTGDFKVRIMVNSGKDGEFFSVYNENGEKIPETPVKLNISKSGESTIVRASGGDPGRRLMLQSTTDFVYWEDVTSHVVDCNLFDKGLNYTNTMSGQKFFRVKAINSPF